MMVSRNLFQGASLLGSILSFGKVADWKMQDLKMYLLETRDFICHVRSLEGIHS